VTIEEHAEAVDALYDLHPREFVAARNELAKRVRAEDREASDEIRKLAKPSVAAWALNTVSGRRPGDVDDLRSTGPAIAGAQEQAVAGEDPGELRRLTEHRRQLVRSLADEAVALVGEAHRDEIEETLQASSVDPDVGELLACRRLDASHAAPTGLEDLAGMLTASAAVVRSTKGIDEERARLRTVLERAEQTVGESRHRVEQARDAVAKAEEQLRQAATMLEQHEQERDRLRAELDALG
jgi:hypothetical protein